jgi:hypothetical protein
MVRDFDRHDRRRNLLDDAGDGGRVGVEQDVIMGEHAHGRLL